MLTFKSPIAVNNIDDVLFAGHTGELLSLALTLLLKMEEQGIIEGEQIEEGKGGGRKGGGFGRNFVMVEILSDLSINDVFDVVVNCI